MTARIDPAWAAPCGLCCRLCEFYRSPEGLRCGGCDEERLCRVEEEKCFFCICTAGHKVEHCGMCEDFPCQMLYETHQQCAGGAPQVAIFRIGDLALRTRMGRTAWLKAKVDGSLPDVWEPGGTMGVPVRKERRRHRRNFGQWAVSVSFAPATQAFGLEDVMTECQNASPVGLLVRLPESARAGFEALARTGRVIEVGGRFPTSRGSTPFAGRVVWYDRGGEKGDARIKVGIALPGATEESD